MLKTTPKTSKAAPTGVTQRRLCRTCSCRAMATMTSLPCQVIGSKLVALDQVSGRAQLTAGPLIPEQGMACHSLSKSHYSEHT